MIYDDDADLTLLDGKTVAIIGYGSQGHAHALNLKDSRGRRRRRPRARLRLGREGARAGPRGDLPSSRPPSRGDLVMILLPDELHHEVWEEEIRDGIAEGNMILFGHGFSIHYGEVEPPAGRRRRHGRAEGPRPPRPPPVHRRQRRARPGRGRAGRHRQRARARARLREGHRLHPRRRDRDDLQGRDRDRPLRRAGRPLRRRLRARPGRLRDARRGRLRPRDGLLRVPARAQADRRPDVREGPRRDALLDLQHGRVRRLHARQARDHRRRRART